MSTGATTEQQGYEPEIASVPFAHEPAAVLLPKKMLLNKMLQSHVVNSSFQIRIVATARVLFRRLVEASAHCARISGIQHGALYILIIVFLPATKI